MSIISSTNDGPVEHPNDSVCIYGQLDALSEVVRAVAGRCEVYVDGGVRTGTDVFKALALGAKAVFVGRPVIYGLACNVSLHVTSRKRSLIDLWPDLQNILRSIIRFH